MDIATLLQNRILASQNGTLKEQLKYESKEYNKAWAKAVQHFQIKINKERVKEKQPPLAFIVIRQKLEHIKEIDDLRFFYTECLKYERKRDKWGRRIKGNTFGKAFWGSLKVR